jgi:diacylglycerol kinase family enzyme
MAAPTTTEKTTIALPSASIEVSFTGTPIGNINYAIDGLLPDISAASSDPRQIVVIDSVYSGIGRENRDFYGTVVQRIFNHLKIAHKYVKTSSAATIKEWAAALTDDVAIVIISGDTSIYEIVNNVKKNLNLQVFPIPLGTGNAIANSIGITDEFKGLEAFLSTVGTTQGGSLKRLPIYKTTFPEGSTLPFQDNQTVKSLYFIAVASWGVHSKLVYLSEAPELKKLGLERFKIAAGQALSSDIKFNAEVSTNPNFKVHNYFNVIAVPNFEKTYRISPDSNIFRNELHLLDIGGASAETSLTNAELGELLMKPYQNGAHIDPNDKRIFYEKISNDVVLTLTEDDPQKAIFCVDGISVQVANPNGKSVKIGFVDEDEVADIRVPSV